MKTHQIIACLILLTGCGTIKTKTPESASGVASPTMDVKKYDVVVVKDFEVRLTNQNAVASMKDEHLQRLTNSCKYFADRIASEFRKQKLFKTVKRGSYTGEALAIHGYVTRYDEGSKAAREWIGWGAGSAYLDADIGFQDSVSGRELGLMKVDKNSSFIGSLGTAQTPAYFMSQVARKIEAQLQAGKGALPKDVPDPTGDEAVVYVYRESKFAGSLATFDITQDGVAVSAMPNGSYFFIHVDPGMHTFSTVLKTDSPQEINVEPGKTYYLKTRLLMSVKMMTMNEAEAKAAIAKLKLIP